MTTNLATMPSGIAPGERSQVISRNDLEYLGVPTGIRGSHHSLKMLTELKNEPGWMVGSGGVREWRFLGFTRMDDQVYVYGPHVSGKSLDEILDLGPEEGLPYMLRLVNALLLLQERDIAPFGIYSDGVLFPDSEEVLFLPPPILAKLKDSRSESYRIGAFEILNHPYLKREQSSSFTIAVLLYKMLTGRYAHADTTVDGVRAKMRNLEVVPAFLLEPALKEEISEFIMRAASKPESCGLKDWQHALSGWIQTGIFRTISDEEKNQLLERARDIEEKALKGLKKKLFFEKHGKRIAVSAIVVVAVGFLIGSFLKNALAPRVTKGFAPAQVVEAFYTASSALDHQTMEDCVVDGAGKGEINEAIHLYVIAKQAIAYEGKSYIVPADKWDSDGRPVVAAPSFVYGVAGLEVKQERGEPEPVFLAAYEKWTRETEETSLGSAAGPLSVGLKIKERLYLRQDKDDWVIYKIDRLESDIIN